MPVTFPSDTDPAPVQSCHPECPRGTSHQQHRPWKRVKSSCLHPPKKLTACLRNQQTTHTQQIFFSFFPPPKTCYSKSHRKFYACSPPTVIGRSSAFFLKKRSKISGQKVTLAHLFWIKIVLVNHIIFIFNGAIGSLKVSFTKHKYFSLQSTAKAEWTSFPTWLTPKTFSRNPAKQCHLFVHTSAAPWIKEQKIICSSNTRFPVANPGNTPPQLKFS